jgi:hypothetical protein
MDFALNNSLFKILMLKIIYCKKITCKLFFFGLE